MDERRLSLNVLMCAGLLLAMTAVLAGCGGREVYDNSGGPAADVSALPPLNQLFVAAQRGDVDLIKEVIDANPDAVNVVDEAGRPLLHAAIESDSAEVVGYLLDKGADPSMEDSQGRDAMMLATDLRASGEVTDRLAAGRP